MNRAMTQRMSGFKYRFGNRDRYYLFFHLHRGVVRRTVELSRALFMTASRAIWP